MKNILLTLSLLLFASLAYCQIKVEASGNVGIGGISNPLEALDVNGKLKVRGTVLELGRDAGSNGCSMKVGGGRSVNGASTFDLVSDQSNYPSYGFRFTRTGNGATQALHRGTSTMSLKTLEEAHLSFFTNSVEVLRISKTGQVAINKASPTEDLDVAGNIKANGVVLTSDKRLKKDVTSFNFGLEAIKQLNPISYKYTGKGGTNSASNHVGIFAQDLQKVCPALVSTFIHVEEDENQKVISEEEFLQIDDTGVKYLLMNAIKEQQVLIEDQQQLIDNLESKLTSIEEKISNISLNDESRVNTNLTLTYHDVASIEQNEPNPFNGITFIDYIVPNEANSAELNIYSNSGKLMKTVRIDHTGEGRLNVQAESLPSGVYSYSLIVDERVVDTKQLVLAK